MILALKISPLKMGTHAIDKLVLEAIEEKGSIETFEFAKELGKDHQSIVGSVKSIHALGDVSEHFDLFTSCLLLLPLKCVVPFKST